MVYIPSTKKIVKNTLILYGRMILTVLISLYSTRLVLAALGNESYGVFTLIMSVVGMLMFLNSAMISTSQRFLSYYLGKENINKQNEIFNLSVLMHLLVGIIVVVTLELMGFILFESIFNIEEKLLASAKAAYQYFVIGAFFRIITSSYEALVIAHEDMFFVAVKAFFESILKLLFALLITYFFKLNLLKTYCLLFSSIYFFGFLISYCYCYIKYNESKIKINYKPGKPLFHEMRDFAKWNLLTASTSSFAAYGQGIILNFYFGTVINSAQGIADQVRGQLEALSTNFSKALSPVIVKSEGAGERKNMFYFVCMGCKLSFFLIFICEFPVIVEAPYILSLWLDDVPNHTVIFVRLILILSLVASPFSGLRTAIGAIGDIKNFEIVFSLLIISPVILAFFLFSINFQPYWLYLCCIFFALTRLVIFIYFSKSKGNLSVTYFLKTVLFPIFIMLVFGLATSFVTELLIKPPIFRICFLIFFNLIISVLVFVFIFINKYERTNLFRLAFKLLNKYIKV